MIPETSLQASSMCFCSAASVCERRVPRNIENERAFIANPFRVRVEKWMMIYLMNGGYTPVLNTQNWPSFS
jgi:hypothetical protein